LLEALAMELADSVVLLLKALQTAHERVGDLEVAIVCLVLGVRLVVIEGSLHLLDGLQQAMRFLGDIVLLTAGIISKSIANVEGPTHFVTWRSWLCSVSDKAEKSSASRESRSWLGTPMSSKRPWSWPMMVVTCCARYEVSILDW
jgi:hypothetical protein